MSMEPSGKTIFTLIDVLRYSWKGCAVVLLMAMAFAVGAWNLMPKSYTGEATMRVTLVEPLYKKAASIFTNPFKANEYFLRQGASAQVMDLVPNRLDKLNSIITPVYAYSFKRERERTKPSKEANHVILITIRVDGTTPETIHEALGLYSDFVRNAILSQSFADYFSMQLSESRELLLLSTQEMLDYQSKLTVYQRQAKALEAFAADHPLPETFQLSIPDTKEALLFLPTQARLAGIKNMLEDLISKQQLAEGEAAQQQWILRYIEQAMELDAQALSAEELLGNYGNLISTTFAEADSIAAEYARMTVKQSYDTIRSVYRGISFTAPPKTPTSSENLKIRLLVTVFVFASVVAMGFVFVVAAYGYTRSRREE